MKCIECKWFAGQHNDAYGVCKRFPQIENKSQQDWCGEFLSKIEKQKEYEYDIHTDSVELKPKRGRKPKA